MEEKPKTYEIEIEGVVQGVGFRPFVYHLAKRLKLFGFVRNTLKGVEIQISGKEDKIKKFISSLEKESPPLSLIKKLKFKEIEYKEFSNFQIIPSHSGLESNIFISPDISICEDCERDFYDKGGRFYKYPFINCTNCGPRFSIIFDFPYDRKNTTMNKFPMCLECRKEYEDIQSRRYHAQPISCRDCGPVFKLYDKFFNEITGEDIFQKVSELIAKGNIIAVKGIGGYHLVLSTEHSSTVLKLRERKKRDRKPFALLFKDIDLIKEYAEVSSFEEEILKSKEKPIVLLKKKKKIINEEFDPISGGSPYYGVMLPYAGFHYLILEKNPVLVCTSANISGEPIVYKDNDLDKLKDIADFFLIHNREIERFVEDSVVKILETSFGEEKKYKILFRKSRGYAPSPFFLKRSFRKKIMGMGSDLKSSISILREDNLIQSQYLGDLTDYESYEEYRKTYEDIKRIYNFEPDTYVSDLHPSFLSTKFAEEISAGKELLKVQHHKAHIASVCLENNVYEETIIGIALDGTGYGEDGMIWGGEIFLGSLKEDFTRVGHLSYTPFPFGDSAIKEPEKTYLSYLYNLDVIEESFYELLSENTIKHLNSLKNFVKNSKIFTSSTGRLFDCVSYLLGFRRRVSYEGEPAIELENLLYNRFKLDTEIDCYNVNISQKEPYIIDVGDILKGVFKDWFNRVDSDLISLRFHATLVDSFIRVVSLISKQYKIKKIALSGGSFQNMYLLYNFLKKLKELNLEPIINSYSPPNDACISVGQCAYALFK